MPSSPRPTRPTRIDLAGLTAQVIGPASATTTVALFHGYGAPGDDLVALGEMYAELLPELRFVFPAGQLSLGGGARAWWNIDMMKIQEQARLGVDRTSEVPDGLVAAREHVGRFLDELTATYAIAPGKLILGGFSQGSMVTLDATLHRAQRPGGLILMSSTLLASSEWLPRMTAVKGLPIVMSHGTQDPVLSFRTAEVLRDKLIAAGADLQWVPFPGGHTIPQPVLAAIAAFLKARGA